MTSSLRLNLGLLLIAIVLGGLIFLEVSAPGPDTPPPLSQLKAEKLVHLTLSGPGQSRIELDRAASGKPWRMTRPFQTEANQDRITRLLRLLSETPQTRYATADVDLAALGFDDDSENLTLVSSDGQQETVIFGDTHPLTRERYIRNGDHVFLLIDTYFYFLRSRATDYASLYLLPQGARINRLVLADKTVQRLDTGWQVTPAPPQQSADAPQILIDHWQKASALKVSEASPSNLPPGTAGDIKVQLASGETLAFRLQQGATDLQLISKQKGLAWHFSREQWGKMSGK